MTAPTDRPVVRREVTVPAPVERAFALFTERFGDVKPHDHSLMDVPCVDTVIEPRVGGAVVDTSAGEQTCRWGTVRAWDPPHRLVFSWDIGPDWELVTDPDNASEVEVVFTAVDAGTTRVTLEHRDLERHGPGWESLRSDVDSDRGWPLYLQRYEALTTSV